MLTKRDQKWWKRFGELEDYKKEHGDCNVPALSYKQNLQLGMWVARQRKNYKQNKMSAERIEALERIGFEWVGPKGLGRRPDDGSWWRRFGELEDYKKEHGDCYVPTAAYKQNPQLGGWVATQRNNYKQNKMNVERIEALERIGFQWVGRKGEGRPDDALWWKRFGELEEYKRRHGDCNVSTQHKENPQLGIWVFNQRARYHQNKTSAERIEALNSIGFQWRLRERPEWDERLDELVSYKQTHGNTLVPSNARKDATNKYHGLAHWVHQQRTQYRFLQEGKHSHLTTDRIEMLDSIGFVWDAQNAAWEEIFAELQEFKANHGHTDVPKTWENKELYNWAVTQRKFYKYFQTGKPTLITKERIEQLDEIGFEWRSKNTYNWMIRFGELRDFYKKHGLGPVPNTEKTLFLWARTQTIEYDKYINEEKTNMDEGRIKALESIGFFDVYGKEGIGRKN